MAISEWDQRQLCPDGACVGVIGPDGTCKTCGRVAPDWGDERRRGLVATDDGGKDGDGDGDGDGAGDGGEEDEIAPSAPALIGEAAVWQRRRLCPDGACIGLLGPDGTCKVCGKSAADAATAEEAAAEEEEDEGDEEEDEGDEEAASDEETNEEKEEEDEGDEEEEEGDDEGDEDQGDSDLGDRKLCPDGACIGVIGPDNRCKVCGKEAA